MIIAATGHRPDKLGGYGEDVLDRLTEFACVHLQRLPEPPVRVISGLAQGWDTAVALAAIQLGYPLITAEPFGIATKWPHAALQRYAFISSKARTAYVIGDSYHISNYQKRNAWMVDHAEQIVALWNGSPGSPGGTANCIAYAEKVKRPIDNLWDRWRGS